MQNGAGTSELLRHKTDTRRSRTVPSFGRLINPAHKRVSRMVGYCLTSLDESAMWSLSAVLNARLNSGERKWLAVAALMALSDDEYQETVDFMEGTQ